MSDGETTLGGRRMIRRAAGTMTRLGETIVETCNTLVAWRLAALADERRNRRRLEADLYGGRYRLSSKNDDDLPIIR